MQDISLPFRHPREGGGPSSALGVCPTVQAMDSRLRGNDEIWGFEAVH